jgi:SagB-type dehydrogenase family enzyme
MPSLDPPPLTELAPLALLYHENSKINRATVVPLAESVGEFISDLDQLRRVTTSAKTYPSAERIEFSKLGRLPVPKQSLAGVLSSRRSVRVYEDRPLALPKVAALFWNACGITGQLVHAEHREIRQHLRAYPSAGALYAIEIYLVAFRVAGLAAGIYHYHALSNCLETVRTGDLADRFNMLLLHPSDRLDAPAVIVLSARWEHVVAKYGERSYRVASLEAGHVAQNILLVATALGLAGCPIAGFMDDALAAELKLDDRQEPPIYAITLGEPCSTSRSRT